MSTSGTGEVANWPDAVVLRKPYDLQGLVQALGQLAPADGARAA
ncbi:hypothetical protein [Telluria aromaticivorans]|nr:hypothetical protein [Telluria aromaticivorans]